MSASDQPIKQHRQQGKPVPSLLSLVTGNRPGTWATLHSYLIDHLGAAFPGELGHLVGRLEQPHDHEDYRRLLHSTWCYLGRVRATLQPGFTAESTQSQGVVLGRAVEAVLFGAEGLETEALQRIAREFTTQTHRHSMLLGLINNMLQRL